MQSRRFFLRPHGSKWKLTFEFSDREPINFGSREAAEEYYRDNLRSDATLLMILSEPRSAVSKAAEEIARSNAGEGSSRSPLAEDSRRFRDMTA